MLSEALAYVLYALRDTPFGFSCCHLQLLPICLDFTVPVRWTMFLLSAIFPLLLSCLNVFT